MSEKRTIAKIGLIGVINQVIFAILGFVSRKLFVMYIGVDLLGLSSTYTSILSALALADLGFDIAVTYVLYKPLHENDEYRINAIMRALKAIYNIIGIFFVVLSFAALPLLKYIINGMEFKPVYYLYFIVQAFSSAATYFFAYRRTLLYADRKEYVTKTVDTVGNIVFSLLKIAVLVFTKSYLLYVTCAVLQAFATNIYIYFKCYKIYPFLDSKIKTDKAIVRELMDNIKDIALGKISGYIYGCTDSLLISTLINTVAVGYYSNYYTVTTIVKQFSINILSPVAPFIGNHLVEDKDPVHQEGIFRMYTYFRFIVACVLLIPTIVCIDTFVGGVWLGEEFIMQPIIVILICSDLYISLVHSSLVDYANGAGLFKYEKYIDLAGAVVNLGMSILLAKFIGLPGILLGTVIAQLVYWILRSILVYDKCFESKKLFGRYWLRMLYYLVIFVACTCLSYFICSMINFKWAVVTFVCQGALCELITIAVVMIAFIPSPEHKQAMGWLTGKLKTKFKRKG